MIIKVLGIFDVFIGLVFWMFGIFNIVSLSSFVLLLGLFLLVKGVVFFVGLSLASLLDIISSIFIIIGSTVGISSMFVVIVSLFLLQKGIFSLLS